MTLKTGIISSNKERFLVYFQYFLLDLVVKCDTHTFQ